MDRAELPNVRFHDLRHTFATHAITNGVDAKTLSGILGHTKASFTLDTYSPRLPVGKRISKNVYAKTEEECEIELAEMIEVMKAEIVEN